MTTVVGLERLLHHQLELVRGRTIALLCHQPSVDRQLRHAADLIHEAGSEVACLLGPEHGVRGEAQDMEGVCSGRDPRLRVPVWSLYGADEASLRPRREWLQGLDAVVIDLQDVGSRYYTYVWTMALTMEVCAEVGVAVIVLDRPNPLDGTTLEGPGIEPGYESFVGLYPLPVRHGLTAGELARLYAAERDLDLELTVVPMEGWRREQGWSETGLPWVLPSPNMPTTDTALVYPGGCLLEGTALSEGRGTTRPFELVGAPWLDGHDLARRLTAEQLPGVVVRPTSFCPTFNKHAGQPCGGIQLHVTDPRAFRPLLTGVAVLLCARAAAPEWFAWRAQAYEFIDAIPAIDLLAGGPWLREAVEAGVTAPHELARGWIEAERAFAARRRPHLLYGV